MREPGENFLQPSFG